MILDYKMKLWFLDCYSKASAIGDLLPVATYGPAPHDDLRVLKDHIEFSFDRVEIVKQTKGLSPIPRRLWREEWLKEI